MREESVKIKNLTISEKLFDFINTEVLPATDIGINEFWDGFNDSVHFLAPKNKILIEKREKLQQQIDDWHKSRQKEKFVPSEYEKFLYKIDYLKKEGKDFKINTKNVDYEISKICAPQLVCPVSNARFILNAANARWVSLYDSLYGSNIIESEEYGSERYDPERGLEVIKYTKKFLDNYFSIEPESWKNVNKITITEKKLILHTYNKKIELKEKEKFVGYRGNPEQPEAVILKNNNLHIEIIINPNAFSAKSDPAGISDIIVESAVTTICDHEDSVAAVDAEDKVLGYRNWLGLMKGNLQTSFVKSGKIYIRKLNPDRKYNSPDGKEFRLKGRSLLLCRNVGHLMTNSAILLKDGSEIPEGIMDSFITVACALHDLKKSKNSKNGSIYIVKPKMHGPEEVQFTCDLFSEVEKIFNLPANTVKLGIMDEERRTTVNLKECIEVAKDRVIFINTGFLDRTGDEIHTSMEAGPFIKKSEMKQQPWIAAYEDWNVDTGLETGFKGKAQIGKGMWPMPDEMLNMYETKTMHPEAGADCAWVPSPTAATLHALHYHQLNVPSVQEDLIKRSKASLEDILEIPLLKNPEELSAEEIQAELDNNAQGILGYVVRWVDQGVGCSKVPDINNVGLMEDRATCRISSQHIANWLHHGLTNEDQVIETMKKMAQVVDDQNKGDPKYENMSPDYSGYAFKAACALVLEGRNQPSGYTEPILHSKRLEYKS